MRKILLNLKGVLLGTLIVVCICSCGNDTVHYVEKDINSEIIEEESDALESEPSQNQMMKNICVYVCGHVQTPGVYTLPEGSRIYDAFALAGGFTDSAATEYWNQARVLSDGEMIYVPSKEEVKDRLFDNIDTGKTSKSDKININTASKEELMTLPGIGEVKAVSILAYRQENGPFSSIEELKQVEGIKEAVFSKIKVYIEI